MQRNEEIVALFLSGKTMPKIGAMFSISRERVSKILAGNGITRDRGGICLVNRANSLKNKVAADKKKRDRDNLFLLQNGCDYNEYLKIPARARRAYTAQKNGAKQRKIKWKFNLFEWWRAWQLSGHWHERGTGNGYCMARKGGVGPYSIDNIYFCTNSQNFKDSYVYRPSAVRNHNYILKNHYVVPNNKSFSLWIRSGNSKAYHSCHKTREAAEAAFAEMCCNQK